MIDKINKEIEELERERKRYPQPPEPYQRDIKKFVEWKENLPVIQAKLEQAKKDKEIIEEGLGELKQEIKQEWVILDDVPRLIDQKLKNQNDR